MGAGAARGEQTHRGRSVRGEFLGVLGEAQRGNERAQRGIKKIKSKGRIVPLPYPYLVELHVRSNFAKMFSQVDVF